MIGQTISHYRILSQLRGGMGVVCEAEDLKLHRHVAYFQREKSSRAFSRTQTPNQWGYHRRSSSASL